MNEGVDKEGEMERDWWDFTMRSLPSRIVAGLI